MNAKMWIATIPLLFLMGCASWFPAAEQKNAASLVSYLYPKKDLRETAMTVSTPRLSLPVRVGLAFVPASASVRGDIPESKRLELLDRVKSAFQHYEFIQAIEVIPGGYLMPQGGFENLDQLTRLFHLDVVALVSYDQVQFNDNDGTSLLYWTIIGAYLFEGDLYDVHTLLDISVFEPKGRHLLLRAPGVSQTKGSATLVGYQEKSRAARLEGFEGAMEQAIANLDKELQLFRQRVKEHPATLKVENRPGYRGGAAEGFLLALVVAAGGTLLFRRR